MGRLIDLTGQKFGRLTVVERANNYISSRGRKKSMWKCTCDCGNCVIVAGNDLKSGRTKSCGCISLEMLFNRNKKYNTYDLSGGYGIGFTTKGEEFWFDLEDYNKIKDYCWSIDKDGFVRGSIAGLKGKCIYFHRVLFPNSIYVDHKEHNRFDNRKEKLRESTPSQNGMNKNIRSDNTSGVAGVHFDKRKNGSVTIDS